MEINITKQELMLIKNKICEIRGMKVMLDFDLAELYGVETKVLNQSVKRNIDRFPLDFMFQLTNQEFASLRSQIVTSRWGGLRHHPYAFAEHGVTMLASVLKSKNAIEINLNVVRAFIALRQYALGYAELNQKIEGFMLETHTQFNEIYELLDEFAAQKKELEKPQNKIGFVLR
ncbi:MAG: ORF6N domain-containing protein [Bacteroidetes bacterium]|nr:ORF6N domain-containing protein [Bacteroidota bacterium]MCL2303135.1 ORF6N domain-containing protein [Lentimicrobiaceae bacterium]